MTGRRIDALDERLWISIEALPRRSRSDITSVPIDTARLPSQSADALPMRVCSAACGFRL